MPAFSRCEDSLVCSKARLLALCAAALSDGYNAENTDASDKHGGPAALLLPCSNFVGRFRSFFPKGGPADEVLQVQQSILRC